MPESPTTNVLQHSVHHRPDRTTDPLSGFSDRLKRFDRRRLGQQRSELFLEKRDEHKKQKLAEWTPGSVPALQQERSVPAVGQQEVSSEGVLPRMKKSVSFAATVEKVEVVVNREAWSKDSTLSETGAGTSEDNLLGGSGSSAVHLAMAGDGFISEEAESHLANAEGFLNTRGLFSSSASTAGVPSDHEKLAGCATPADFQLRIRNLKDQTRRMREKIDEKRRVREEGADVPLGGSAGFFEERSEEVVTGDVGSTLAGIDQAQKKSGPSEQVLSKAGATREQQPPIPIVEAASTTASSHANHSQAHYSPGEATPTDDFMERAEQTYREMRGLLERTQTADCVRSTAQQVVAADCVLSTTGEDGAAPPPHATETSAISPAEEGSQQPTSTSDQSPSEVDHDSASVDLAVPTLGTTTNSSSLHVSAQQTLLLAEQAKIVHDPPVVGGAATATDDEPLLFGAGEGEQSVPLAEMFRKFSERRKRFREAGKQREQARVLQKKKMSFSVSDRPVPVVEPAPPKKTGESFTEVLLAANAHPKPKSGAAKPKPAAKAKTPAAKRRPTSAGASGGRGTGPPGGRPAARRASSPFGWTNAARKSSKSARGPARLGEAEEDVSKNRKTDSSRSRAPPPSRPKAFWKGKVRDSSPSAAVRYAAAAARNSSAVADGTLDESSVSSCSPQEQSVTVSEEVLVSVSVSEDPSADSASEVGSVLSSAAVADALSAIRTRIERLPVRENAEREKLLALLALAAGEQGEWSSSPSCKGGGRTRGPR